MTPLLGWFMLEGTWANVREHAADPHDDWGSSLKGRGRSTLFGQGFWDRFVLGSRLGADKRRRGVGVQARP